METSKSQISSEGGDVRNNSESFPENLFEILLAKIEEDSQEWSKSWNKEE